jgi:hypothetical protein
MHLPLPANTPSHFLGLPTAPLFAIILLYIMNAFAAPSTVKAGVTKRMYKRM